MVVRFTPIGAQHFLGLPLSLVANQAVQLSQIDPTLEELILGRVGRARSWSDRFLAIETLIAERLLDPETSSSMEWAWNLLIAANGAVPLGLLATEIGCSHRHLIAQFRSRIGLPPKAIARVLRFNRALRLLNKPPDDRADRPAGKPYIETGHSLATRGETTPWADIAARCGYFDQSHFIKEFRRFAGITPNAFLQRMSNID